MLDAGMNVARLDFSFEEPQNKAFHPETKLKNLKEAMTQRPDKKCAILIDLKGPEIRTNIFAVDLEFFNDIKMKKGQSLTIVADPDFLSTADSIGCTYT